MQIFEEVQNSFISIGFSPKQDLFNRRISGILAMTLLGVVLLSMFLVLEADSAQEYMESFYITTTSFGILLSIASTIFIKQKLFPFKKSGDEIVNESELNFNQLFIENN